MDEATLVGLTVTAGSIGFVHTLSGPDHYVPFVAMSRVGRWSYLKTMIITLACGVGHVLSSIILGAIGITLGLAIGGLEWFESVRGSLAGWLLLGFGLAYLAWGIKHALRNKPHTHVHAHGDGVAHSHTHAHTGEHAHPHAEDQRVGAMTPWVLFTIFVFGPCEPLIPMLMFPAAELSVAGVALVAVVFSVCTLATMLAMVTAGYYGLSRLSFASLSRYGHAIAGFALASCGAAIKFGL
jgi:sulfite exporter TauE/SafE